MIPFTVAFTFDVINALRARDLTPLADHLAPAVRRRLDARLADPADPLHAAVAAYNGVQGRRADTRGMCRFADLPGDRVAVLLLDLPRAGGVHITGIDTVPGATFNNFGHLDE